MTSSPKERKIPQGMLFPAGCFTSCQSQSYSSGPPLQSAALVFFLLHHFQDQQVWLDTGFGVNDQERLCSQCDQEKWQLLCRKHGT